MIITAFGQRLTPSEDAAPLTRAAQGIDRAWHLLPDCARKLARQ